MDFLKCPSTLPLLVLDSFSLSGYSPKAGFTLPQKITRNFRKELPVMIQEKICDSVQELSALCLSLLADEAERNQMEQNLSNLSDNNAAQTIYHYLKIKWSKNL